FSSRRRHTRSKRDWSSDVCSSDLILISTIPLLEAQASSEVENIVTTTDDLFRFDAQVETDSTPATKETMRYRSALFAGLESIKNRPLIFATAVEICSEILGRQMQVRDLPGTYISATRTVLPSYTTADCV